MMPGRNGMGPMGCGPMAGRGLGARMAAGNAPRLGLGPCGMGLARGFGRDHAQGCGTGAPVCGKASLEAQRDALKDMLRRIEDRLSSL